MRNYGLIKTVQQSNDIHVMQKISTKELMQVAH